MFAFVVAVTAAAVLAGAASADKPNVLEKNHAHVREVPHAATPPALRPAGPFTEGVAAQETSTTRHHER
jgi:hypothetical protein